MQNQNSAKRSHIYFKCIFDEAILTLDATQTLLILEYLRDYSYSLSDIDVEHIVLEAGLDMVDWMRMRHRPTLTSLRHGERDRCQIFTLWILLAQ